MSIEAAAQLEEDAMDSSQERSKSHKKHRSAPEKEKKKRKREGEDGHRSKSKKHKSDNPASQASPAPEEEEEKPSPFHVQTSSLYLPLAPIAQSTPLEGLCAEHISPLILRYFPPLGGVVLSYSNPRLSSEAFGNDGPSTLMQCVDEGAATWGWVTAEFLLFKPNRGALLEGYINLQNSGHIGVVCWNLFNANIMRNSLPEDWTWVGTEDQVAEEGDEKYAEDGVGYYVDGDGKKIEGVIKFRVREIESSYDKETGFLSIEGTMLDDKAEKQLLKSQNESYKASRETAGRRLGGAKALGATSLAVEVEPDLMDAENQTRKHRQKY